MLYVAQNQLRGDWFPDTKRDNPILRHGFAVQCIVNPILVFGFVGKIQLKSQTKDMKMLSLVMKAIDRIMNAEDIAADCDF